MIGQLASLCCLVGKWLSRLRINDKSISFRFNHVLSRIAQTSSKRFSTDTFRHPVLSEEELNHGAKLGVDSWADTCCAGKHCYVEEFLEGKVVNATGFTPSLGSVQNLPIAHVLYAYDSANGEVYLLECNNSIYLGEEMVDSLVNPIQCEENEVRIDIRPRAYYPNSTTAQSVCFENGVKLELLYDGVLPYLPVRRPTPDEIHHCQRLVMTSKQRHNQFVLKMESSLNCYMMVFYHTYLFAVLHLMKSIIASV